MGDLPTAILVAMAAVAGAMLLLTWSLLSTSESDRRQTLTNLQRGLDGLHARPSTETGQSGPVVRLARMLTPASWMRTLDRLHAGAGRPSGWPLERVLASKVSLAAVMTALGVLLVSGAATPRNVILAVAMAVLGWFAPEILLYNHSTKRRKEIQKRLPDTLDQLTIAVEAGLGFEAAIAHVGRNSPGPLGDELIRTLQDIQVGAPRRTAYLALAERAQVDDLTRFVRAITQAEQYGVSVASVLQAQAQEMRVKRRQRAEEAALKIPVKVVFPLIAFILPTLFIVVLGPAVLSAINAFSGGGLLGNLE